MTFGIGLRHLSRLREIVSVLVFGYGFGYVFDQLGISRLLPVGRRRRPSPEYSEEPGPRQLRLALAELGPTFIKLGQIIGARADLLPAAAVSELRRLQDEGPKVPFPLIRGVIERELGRPIERCFASISEEPLSSASLGQVHAAVLPGGREVTVKVLRPGVRKIVETDVQILADLAALLTSQVRAAQPYDLQGLVRHFAVQMEDEMSYTIEAHNAGRLKQSMLDAGINLHIPEVIWELTSREVLTTERVRGHRTDRLSESGLSVDRKAAAALMGQAILHQIFVDGFFHADPHHGNMLLGDDGRVILLDFGIVGYLDPRTRRLVAESVRHVYDQDIEGLVMALSEFGTVGPDADPTSLRAELGRVARRFMLLPRREFPMGEVLMRTLRALWVNHVRVPPDVSQAAKALLVAEAVASDLDPDFDLGAAAQPVLEQAKRKELAPSEVGGRALHALESAARRLSHLPARLDRVLSLAEQGGLRLRVEETEINRRWGVLARVLNRLSLGIVTAGLLISGALLLVMQQHPAHVGLGTAALVLAVILGLIVAIRTVRPGQL
ncbi:MAG: ABC1 kinase family protein [Armatimonadota bacterium]